MLTSWRPRLLSLLRVMGSALFVQHGMQKMLSYPPPPHAMDIHPFGLLWFAGILELVGGALLLVGLFTRPVAFVLSGEMAVAYFTGHAPHGFWPVQNGGELAVLYCFLFLYLAAAGGGPISLDSRRLADEQR